MARLSTDLQEPGSLTRHRTGNHPLRQHQSETVDHPFNFPLLNLDGSVDTQRSHQTPPAALSSRGAKMSRTTLSDSVSTVDDASYDMVDDISELSSDDRETVSIASTELHDEHEDETCLGISDDPDMLEDIRHLEEQRPTDLPSLHTDDETLEQYRDRLVREDHEWKRRFMAQIKLDADETQSRSTAAESIFDEHETPRQSTIATKKSSQLHDRSKGNDLQSSDAKTTAENKAMEKPSALSTIAAALTSMLSAATFRYLVLTLVAGHVLVSIIAPMAASVNFRTNHASRRAELLATLADFVDPPDVTKTFNITHLLPEPTVVKKNILGMQLHGNAEIRYQGVAPNYIVISLPGLTSGPYPTPTSLLVLKDSITIQATFTRLINGVYGIKIDPGEAHGIVSVSLSCEKPKLAASLSHNFGNRMLHRHTYEKARTNFGKSLAKDVAVAREVAKTAGERVQADFGAIVRDTRRIASDIVGSVASELTTVAQHASHVLDDVQQDGKVLAKSFLEDAVALGGTVEQFVDDAAEKAKSMMSSSKIIKQSIILSRERALIISQKLSSLSSGARDRINRRTTSTDLMSQPFKAVAIQQSRSQHSGEFHRRTRDEKKDGSKIPRKQRSCRQSK